MHYTELEKELLALVYALQKFRSSVLTSWGAKGYKNSVADHQSHLHIPSKGDISDTYPNEHLLEISSHVPWFVHIINFLVMASIPEHWSQYLKNKVFDEL